MGRAIWVESHGGPEALRVRPHDPGPPGPGEVVVRVGAAGVNFIDVYHRTGLYPRPLPFVLGLEGCGIVEVCGPGVENLAPGDRVAWASVPGSYAERVRGPARALVRVPRELSDEEAAAAMLQGMTAHYLVYGVRNPRAGEIALVHAAAGGTGLLLVQTLRRAGLRVIGTCSTPEKARLAREAGAERVVLYGREDFVSATQEFSSGEGADVVYDSVGKDTFEGSLRALRRRGLLVLFGQSSGPVPPFDLRRLNEHGSLFVTRPSLAHYIATREELEERAGAVLGAVARGELRIRIGGRFPLEEAARAHEILESRASTGKLLLFP